MTKYVQNLNAYLNARKIKQTYLSMKTGIDPKKISRLLTGVQEITAADMEKIAYALGEKPDFFLREPFLLSDTEEEETEKIVFYAGEPTGEQEAIADKLLELMENIDEVLSARGRFLNITHPE